MEKFNLLTLLTTVAGWGGGQNTQEWGEGRESAATLRYREETISV
jgi:hypothetical protein